MSKGYPATRGFETVAVRPRQVAEDQIVGRCRRQKRTVLWPFKAKTSRTQPKAAEWIFSPAVWLRSLIKPGPGRAVAYIDYSAMEFMLAAALSEDRIMLELYTSGDPYLAFARRVGAVPVAATKTSHKAERDIYKVVLLAAQYGMSAPTLSVRLGIPLFQAQELLYQHRTLFAQYWRWSDDWVARSLDTGLMRTVFNWQCRTGITELRRTHNQEFSRAVAW